jgi:hypothetical protein
MDLEACWLCSFEDAIMTEQFETVTEFTWRGRKNHSWCWRDSSINVSVNEEVKVVSLVAYRDEC